MGNESFEISREYSRQYLEDRLSSEIRRGKNKEQFYMILFESGGGIDIESSSRVVISMVKKNDFSLQDCLDGFVDYNLNALHEVFRKLRGCSYADEVEIEISFPNRREKSIFVVHHLFPELVKNSYIASCYFVLEDRKILNQASKHSNPQESKNYTLS